MRTIPVGRQISLEAMQTKLARCHRADVTCSTTTGIFLGILSEVAFKALGEGKSPDEVASF